MYLGRLTLQSGLENEGKENEIPAPGGFRPSDQSYRPARPSSPQRSRAPAQVGSQLSRPAPADYAFCKYAGILAQVDKNGLVAMIHVVFCGLALALQYLALVLALYVFG
ncbi:hypothetical protein U1Q18_041084 [Sarracenia purpurea var. burkii]